MTVLENIRPVDTRPRDLNRERRWGTAGVVGLCLLLGAIVSVWLGQDANWDLRNYHLYNGWAALHGRLHTDLAAASLQSWINPTLDIPYAWLVLGPLSREPRLLAAFMGLWYGALIAAVLGIAILLYRPRQNGKRWAATAAATILGCTGAAVISQVGTTFNEIQTGLLVMISVFLLMREAGPRTSSGMILLAGVLLGLATGLKITSAIYAPAAALAFVAVLPRRRWAAALALLVTGGIAGIAIGGGWWGARLWLAYGNPVFPFFNGIFHSPWYPPVNFFDRRFLPHDVWQWLFYPFFWLGDKPMLVTEIPFRDGRVAVFYALGTIFAGVVAYRGCRRLASSGESEAPLIPLEPNQLFLLLFAVISYVLWLGTTSILRYGIPVEVSAALLVPLLLSLLMGGEKSRRTEWISAGFLCALVLLLLASTRYPKWGRSDYEVPAISADMNWLPPHALVVFVGAPVAYVAPFAPASSGASFLGLTDVVFESRGYRLANAVMGRIRHHHGPIFIVWTTADAWRLPSVAEMGLRKLDRGCRVFYGRFEQENRSELQECPAVADLANSLRSPFWKRAAARYDEIEMPEYPVAGWSYANFIQAAGKPAMHKKYIDEFEYLWSRAPDRPKAFDDRILPHTLYILNAALERRAARAMNGATDFLGTVDGVLVLAPRWKARQAPAPLR